ncbi:right-handed parallel beta-helix repeat-containing protein [uncultured Roseibium sp.]|uniref:right-handed parallel beta-helix repeat-containing protein n=1 Tax=uncultured Roseibium sp. TaxID=1936171 RepID=UPI002638DB8F|nr:right-handed parallel beta-helix repeat-containing protein [uncultured Roseibium sp.]
MTASSATEFRVSAGPGNAQQLIDAGKLAGGDRIVLASGSHGSIVLNGLNFETPLTITAENDALAEVDQLLIEDSSGLRIEGLVVLPRGGENPDEALVTIQQGKNIELNNMTVASANSTEGWTAALWQASARDGIFLSGKNIALTDSRIFNVRHAISTYADNARIERNVIEFFSGDGIRGLGNNSDYVENLIDTCVGVDRNHDDGFQSWSLDAAGEAGKGTVRNVRLERNKIRNGDHPLTCYLQGIGLFDGFYENWIIRGNTIAVDHWHGITVMGARGVIVSENTVTDSRPGKPGAPSITVMAHKDGTPAQDSVIELNVTQPWQGGAKSPFARAHQGVTLLGNRVVETLPAFPQKAQ